MLEILPCRPFHEWNLSELQDAAEPAPSLQAEAVPEHGPAHSDIIASLRNLATIGRGVEIRSSRISEAGQGLYATRAFDSFEFITEYDGVRNSLEERMHQKTATDAHLPERRLLCRWLPVGEAARGREIG